MLREIKSCKECGSKPKIIRELCVSRMPIGPSLDKVILDTKNGPLLVNGTHYSTQKIRRVRITCSGQGHKVVYIRKKKEHYVRSVVQAYIKPITHALITGWNARQD